MRPVVIFDMDGVLVDSEPLHFQAARLVYGAAGVVVTEDVYREIIGRTLDDSIEFLAKEHQLQGDITRIKADYDTTVLEILSRPLIANDGVHWLLGELRRRGCVLGLASSSQRNWVDATLRGLGLTDVFDSIVSGDQVSRGKPAPDIYRLAASELKMDPSLCIAVEDSAAGVQAAIEASMIAIGLRTPHVDPSLLSPAHQVIASLRDFPLALVGHPGA